VAGAYWRSSLIFLTDIAGRYLSAFVAEIAWRKETVVALRLEICLRHDHVEPAGATSSSRPAPNIENRTLGRVRHGEIWSYAPNRIFLQAVQHFVVVVWVVMKCNKLPRADVRCEFERMSVGAMPPSHTAVVFLIRILSVVYE
jgi:hypothetical protein